MTIELHRTSDRTFVLWPVLLLFEARVRCRRIDPRGLALAVGGYLLYRVAGARRLADGGGGPGLASPPEELVTDGWYGWSRNPMYVGHLVTFTGLAMATRSPVAMGALGWHLRWFDERAAIDEQQLSARFGPRYEAYRRSVPRWVGAVRR